MAKRKVMVLLGGVSPEHEISLRSAACILTQIDHTKNEVIPVGITKDGVWYRLSKEAASMLPSMQWVSAPGVQRCALSPSHGEGLITFTEDGIQLDKIDVVFPILHGENGEDGSMQGLLQIAGIPYVGPHVAASAACMDKTMTKLTIDQTPIRQAKWYLVTRGDQEEAAMDGIEAAFQYPVFVKPAGTGSSVGVSKARNREELKKALREALKYDRKVLAEEFIHGHEIEVAVLGNENPVASVCGEIMSGAEFYDYEAKYISDTSSTNIPAALSPQKMQEVQEAAVRVYQAMGCQGLSRVDFFVTYEGEQVVFNEINTLPGFTSISMYPKLFDASGIPCTELIERLIEFALKA